MPGYRPPATGPSGKWAIAIHKKRRADDLSRTELFELLGPRLGYSAKSLSAFRLLDIGERPPKDDEATVLAGWLGYWPEEEESKASPPTSDGGGLAALAKAIDDQAKAITALADQVKALAEAQSPAAAAALTAQMVALAIAETLPDVLLAAGLRPK